MAFNGVGVYNPPVPPDFPAVTGQTIQASHYNTVVNDIATALTKCVTRDGQTPIQANLPMTGFKHTGVANAVANDEYVALGQSTAALTAGLAAQLRNKNHIINGNFDVWQRATSQTTSGYGSVDRWINLHLGSTKTISRQAFTLGQTAVPGEPAYYSRTGVSSFAGVGNYVIQQQKIESVRTLAGQTCTVSFWAKADASRNIAIEFGQNFGTGGSPSAQVNAIGSQLVALTTTWTKYTKTIAIPSISGKTLGTAGDDSLEFTFWFDAGSNWNTRTASLGQQSGDRKSVV